MKQDFYLFFSHFMMGLSAALASAATGCNESLPGAAAGASPYQTYQTANAPALRPVESCLDDNPNPPPSCI